MRKTIYTTLLVILSLSAFAQKKPLDHSVYDGWKNIGAFTLTEDAQYTLFMINPQEGDSKFVSHNISTGEQFEIPRGTSYKVTWDGKYAVLRIKPTFEETKSAKQKKLKPEQMPKDTLGIYNIRTNELNKIPCLKDGPSGFKIEKYSKNFFAFQTTPAPDTSKNKKPAPKKENGEGSDLMIYYLNSGITDTLKYVTDYSLSEGGDSLFFIRVPNSKDSVYSAGLYMYLPATKSLTTIYNTVKKQSVKLPVVSKNNKSIVFYANLDTVKGKDKDVSILLYRSGFEKAKVILDNSTSSLPSGYRVSENRSLQFDTLGNRLFFGIGKILPEKDTSIVESEMAKLDIWHYQEPYIQPYQLINLAKEQKKTYMCKVELDGDPKFVQLATEDYELVYIPSQFTSDWAYSASDKRYEIESQWSADPHRDLYIIDINTGSSKRLLEDAYIGYVSPSPEGNYLVWFDLIDRNWYSYQVSSGKIAKISGDIPYSLTDELHDTPEMAPSYGHGGWAKKDAFFYIYDRYDVWKIDPKGIQPALCMTDGLGRDENKTFRIVRLDEMLLPPGTPGIKMEPLDEKETIYFSVFDNKTKENGYYFKEMKKRKAIMTKWIQEPYTFVYLTKAKKGSSITYVKHNFTTSPDLWITKDGFKTQTKVTDINPQQKDYNWGTNELVKWKSATGLNMEGLLHKPENFDPAKKYPMIVYFYERTSDMLHYYRAPAPSRSTINITFFTSNGYLVFVPDIAYEIGHPGKSALDCIVPGVKKLCENPWVDKDNIAIQGQSWGGYQVAYMITQPQVFKWKAAGAGAAVANMTSAYGGLRYGTGVVRQFQYEDTQSRIGSTLWDRFDLYYENSPIFFADKIETPVLIMHNDNDEAVPWQQGIEFFTALKRLGKPAWMLQYNKESHNLESRINAKDLSIRLSQFFDHFLKGAPMPVWMSRGVPATLKGIDWGFEIEEQK